MISLYAKYIKERQGTDIIETDKYFVTYQIEGNEMMVFDMFIDQRYRGSKVTLELKNRIFKTASDNKVRVMFATTDIDTKGWNHAEKCMYHVGFKLDGQENSTRYYSLELGDL